MTDLASELAALRREVAELRSHRLDAYSEAHRTALAGQACAMWALALLKTAMPGQFEVLLRSQRLLVQKYRTEGQTGPLEMLERLLAVMEEAQTSAPLLANRQSFGPK